MFCFLCKACECKDFYAGMTTLKLPTKWNKKNKQQNKLNNKVS